MNLILDNFLAQKNSIENFVFKNLDFDYISISKLINLPFLTRLKNSIRALPNNQSPDFKKKLFKQMINKFKKELILSRTEIEELNYYYSRLEYYYLFKHTKNNYKKITNTNLLVGSLNYNFFCKNLETNKEDLIACLCIKKEYIEDFLIDLLSKDTLLNYTEVSVPPSYFALLINIDFWDKNKYPKLKRFRKELLEKFYVDRVFLKRPLQEYLYTSLPDAIPEYRKIISRIDFNRDLLLEAVQEQNWINKNNLKFELN